MGAAQQKICCHVFLVQIAKFHTNSDLHPGEHAGDQAAHLHFLEQSVAYQILSDPAKREKYDKEGKASVDFSVIDPRAFVTMAYGSEAFEPLVSTAPLPPVVLPYGKEEKARVEISVVDLSQKSACCPLTQKHCSGMLVQDTGRLVHPESSCNL